MNTVQSSPAVQDSPILRLPPTLRRRIYSHFHDALGRDPFTLSLNGRNGWPNRELGFYSLLLSCSTIYQEVSGVLYSANYFHIKYEDVRSLQPIRNLSDASLSSLTELKIVLNEASCHGPECFQCCDDMLLSREVPASPSMCPAAGHTGRHDQPLRPSDHSANSLLEDWRLTAAYLWSRVRPKALNISLVCDFDAQDPRTCSAARLAVAPLINLAPLRGCRIRLCRTRHGELDQISRNAVLRARGIVNQDEPTYTLRNSTARSGSMFMSLPRELRFRILQYTDLITPWKEVTWSRQHGAYQASVMLCYGLECPAQLHHGCQFRKCWTGLLPSLRMDPRSLGGCFCRVRHAAFSLKCRCWGPPTDLFLVCRALCEEAQVIFFSGNRFVVHDYKSDTPWDTHGPGSYPSERLAVSEFLTQIVPVDCLAAIRSLEVTFPPYSPDAWPQDGCRALSDWGETVRLIRQKMNLEGLNLRLNMYDVDQVKGNLRQVTEPQSLEVLQAYTRILAPLAGLGKEGLKDFYAYIMLPEKWTEWFREKGPGYWDRVLREERMLKKRAESLVMDSRYDEQPEEEFYYDCYPVNSVWRYQHILRY